MALIVAFVVTRLVVAWLADHPELYGPHDTKVTGDTDLYASWAAQLAGAERAPYSEVAIEYPPGSLPFIVLPRAWEALGHSYRSGFIASMLAVDAFGFAGCLVVGRRWGSTLGGWAWVALIPLLGPISYVRLDLVPAVATIWAIERASIRSWLGAGGWLGFALVAKLYAGLLAPAAWVVAGRRRSLLWGLGAVTVLPLIPLAGSLPQLWHSVIGYHTQRGIQVESTWGVVLLVASKLGYAISVGYNFGAFHVASGASSALKALSNLASVAAVASGTWLAARRVERDDAGALAVVMFGTLTLVLAAGSVLSPQFLLWAAALGAAAAGCPRFRLGTAITLLATAAALSQILYPFVYNRLLMGDPGAVLVLGVRNLLLLAAGAAALLALPRRAPR